MLAEVGGQTCERFVLPVFKVITGSRVGLYCVTTTWQQIFIGSLQVTVESVLPHVT